jgi:hypothetical protein
MDIGLVLRALMGNKTSAVSPAPNDLIGRTPQFASPELSRTGQFANPAMSAYSQPKQFYGKFPDTSHQDQDMIKKAQEQYMQNLQQRYMLQKLMQRPLR